MDQQQPTDMYKKPGEDGNKAVFELYCVASRVNKKNEKPQAASLCMLLGRK